MGTTIYFCSLPRPLRSLLTPVKDLSLWATWNRLWVQQFTIIILPDRLMILNGPLMSQWTTFKDLCSVNSDQAMPFRYFNDFFRKKTFYHFEVKIFNALFCDRLLPRRSSTSSTKGSATTLTRITWKAWRWIFNSTVNPILFLVFLHFADVILFFFVFLDLMSRNSLVGRVFRVTLPWLQSVPVAQHVALALRRHHLCLLTKSVYS